MQDAIGSVDTITDRTGNIIVERLSYDAWGKRRAPNWDDAQGQLSSSVLDRGFTGHEHLDDLNLIHMNGRVYYPSLGRFVSADPTVQYPKYSQSLNRYSYVVNNPLSYTDPSGFGFFSELLDFHHKIDPIQRTLDNIVAKSTTLQQIGGVAAGVASAVWGQPWIAAVYAAHITNLKGGSTFDIAKAGAIAGGAAYASSEIAGANLNFAAKVTAHGVVGGAVSAANGGDFRDGFYAGAVTAAFSPAINSIKGNTVSASVARITVAAVIGGTASELSGGKFANGAQTAAFLRAVTEASVYYEHRMGGKAGGSASLRFYSDDGVENYSYRAGPNGVSPCLECNAIGHNEPLAGSFLADFDNQGGALAHALGVVPFVPATAQLHDAWWNVWVLKGVPFNAFTNYGTMLPAAGISVGAVIGNYTRGWQNNQLIWREITRPNHD